MDVRTFLRSVAERYDRLAGLSTDTQRLLRSAGSHLDHLVPAGYEIVGSGGKGTATLTPWVGFFDPDETTSPEEGLYVVYLWAADLASVSLVLLQGITKLGREVGPRAARALLEAESAQIRAGLQPASIGGLDLALDLGSLGFRQLGYSAACVVARRYEFSDLPTEEGLRSDLDRFLALYQDAIGVKRRLAISGTATATSAANSQLDAEAGDLLAHFRPRDDTDYVAHLQGRSLVKSRRHERLVNEYGRWAADQGFAPSTRDHPQDLLLRREGNVWLVEGKILYRGNATAAVRAAIGQLFTYRYFLWPSSPTPSLLALFSEPVGSAYVALLEELAIAAVWKEGGTWRGSPSAITADLAESTDGE